MAAVNRRRTAPSRPGSRLLRVGLILIVLGAAFGGGFLTGRHLERKGQARVIHDVDAPGDAANGSTPRTRGRAGASDPSLPRIQEKLTFYQTLTAPLTGAPASERAPNGKSEGKPSAPPPRPASVPPPAPAAPVALPGPRAEGSTGYTIQVAAYRTRAQADALRAKLGAEAYVVEGTTDSGTAFRVRVGAFASRAEAEAVRVERSLGGFIAPR